MRCEGGYERTLGDNGESNGNSAVVCGVVGAELPERLEVRR